MSFQIKFENNFFFINLDFIDFFRFFSREKKKIEFIYKYLWGKLIFL
jgi:hypothetical protein